MLTTSPPSASPTASLEAKGTLDRMVVALALLCPLIFMFDLQRLFADGDVSWHIATGRWIFAHGGLPRTDPFSFSAFGQPWQPIEWLSEVALAGAFNAGGYSGLVVVATLVMVAINLVVLGWARRFCSPVRQLMILVGANGILMSFILARPHLFAWVLLTFWTVGILRARERGRAPSLWLALLVVVWANAHGSWPFAFLVAAPLGLEAMIEARWDRRAFIAWLLFGLVSLAAAACTPLGLDGLLHPFRIGGMKTLTMINEWKASDIRITPVYFFVCFALIAALVWMRRPVPPVRLAMLLGLILLGLWQVRHQAPGGIVGALLAAPLIGDRTRIPPLVDSRREGILVSLVAGALLLAWIAARIVIPHPPEESPTNPHGLLRAVPPALRSAPVINGYSFGGPMILAGMRPFIDGRADLYGDQFVIDYGDMLHGDLDKFAATVKRYDIRWTMLPVGNDGLVSELDHLPGWHRIYTDKIGVIHVRDDALPAAGAATLRPLPAAQP